MLLGLSFKKCDVCVSKCQSPAVPESVDKMLEVKSSDAVRIWMNSFAMFCMFSNTPIVLLKKMISPNSYKSAWRQNMEHQNTFGIPSTVLSTLLDFNIFQSNTVTSVTL
jgi:hypothetical protein